MTDRINILNRAPAAQPLDCRTSKDQLFFRPVAKVVGFNIVELLIVLFVISLLMALSLPALSKVRKKAQESACLSNMSQIGKGMAIYAIHNNDFILRTGPHIFVPDGQPSLSPPEYVVWPAMLTEPKLGLDVNGYSTYRWIQKQRLLRCPSHPGEGYPSHYVINAIDLRTPRMRDEFCFSGPTRLSAVRNASRVGLLFDLAIMEGISTSSQWIGNLLPDEAPGGGAQIWSQRLSTWAPQLERFTPEGRVSLQGTLCGLRISSMRHGLFRSNMLKFDLSAGTFDSRDVTRNELDDGISDRRYKFTVRELFPIPLSHNCFD